MIITVILVILILNTTMLFLGLVSIYRYLRNHGKTTKKQTLTDVGKAWVVSHREDILVITDRHYNIVYLSGLARSVFSALKSLSIGDKLPDDMIGYLKDDTDTIETQDHIYRKMVSPLEMDERHAGYGLYFEDVTRLVKAERHAAEEQKKAEQAIQVKNRFLENVSREIRNPMSATMDATEMLTNKDLPDTKKKAYLKSLQDSSDTLMSIMSEVSVFNDLEQEQLEIKGRDYQPQEMIRSIGNTILSRIGGKRVEVIFDIDPELPRVLNGDSTRLRQVLLSILNNAVRFTMQGSIRFTVKMMDVQLDQAELFFSVKDTGLGFREEDIEKLFTPFHPDGKENAGGTGLELSIAKRLVELMGSDLHVKSEFRQGTEMFFSVKQQIIDPQKSVERDLSVKPVISSVMSTDEGTDNIRKLAMQYGAQYVEFTEVSEKAVTLDYLFTDDEDLSFPDAAKYLKDAHVSVVMLQNPMVEVVNREDVVLINKPLYNRNFCEVLGGGITSHEEEHPKKDKKQGDFTAKDARILLVDDNPMNRKVATGLLKPTQIKIDEAENGSDAVQKVLSNQYQMIFMDHMMPIMDGVEATRRIRSQEDYYCQNVPIIALTANAVDEAQDKFLEAGMNDYLAKPITGQTITAMVEKWLPKKYIQYADGTTSAGNVDQAQNASDGLHFSKSKRENLAESKDTKAQEKSPEARLEEEITEQIPGYGIDVKEGCENSGSIEMLQEMMGDYHDAIPKKSQELEELLEKEDYRNFTIQVHALKSTSRIIGAMKMSDEFREMEDAGNAGEVERIRRDFPEILSHYKSYGDTLLPFGHHENTEGDLVSLQQMIDCLQQIYDGMDSFDLDQADAGMHDLDQYQIPDQYKEPIGNIRNELKDVDMEHVLIHTKELIENLKAEV